MSSQLKPPNIDWSSSLFCLKGCRKNVVGHLLCFFKDMVMTVKYVANDGIIEVEGRVHIEVEEVVGNGGNGNNGGNPDIAAMIAHQLQACLPTIVMQISNSVINQGNGNGRGGEDNSNGENNKGGHEHGNLRNGDNNYNGNGCSYKEFLTCQLKEFDGKGGALAYTRWVEKMESVIDMSNCAINQRVKYVAGSLTW
ncbi:hypothetical protein Tco_1431848 [Tanacetum coccineum]